MTTDKRKEVERIETTIHNIGKEERERERERSKKVEGIESKKMKTFLSTLPSINSSRFPTPTCFDKYHYALKKVRRVSERLVGSDGNLDFNARLDRHRSLKRKRKRKGVNFAATSL